MSGEQYCVMLYISFWHPFWFGYWNRIFWYRSIPTFHFGFITNIYIFSISFSFLFFFFFFHLFFLPTANTAPPTCPYLIRFFHLTFSPPHVFFAILLNTLLTFSFFFNFLLRLFSLSISCVLFFFFSPASILHGHCSLAISSVFFFFSSSPASRQSRHLNQKTKKKKGKEKVQRQRESWAEERRRRKREKGSVRSKERKNIYIKSQKSIPAGLHIPAETGRNSRNKPKFWPRWNMGVSRTGLHADTRFSVHSDQNGTKYTTLILWSHAIMV